MPHTTNALIPTVAALAALAFAPHARAQTEPATEPAALTTTPVAASPAPETPPAPAAPETPPTPAVAALAIPAPAAAVTFGPLMAGWHNDVFYLTEPTHNFFLIPGGRLQLDTLLFVGDDAASDYTTSNGQFHRADVQDGLIVRRARIEVFGGFLDRFTFQLGADYALASAPVATDLWVDARIAPFLHFQLGQFDAPFTMENRTPDKYLDFMERSLAVRALGFPSNKDLGLMMWGETPSRLFYYSLGVFDGDGQNRTNRDSYFDAMGRIFAHPFITVGGPLRDLQIGGSFRYGWRGPSVDYAYPAMSTAGLFTIFNPQIASGANPITVVPDRDQLGLAAELDLPLGRFDVRGEYVYVHNGTAEMPAASTDTAHLAGNAIRHGDLAGSGYYVQVGYWLWGNVGVNGRPGYENPPSLRLGTPDPAQPPQGLQAVARFQSLEYHYNGGDRSDPVSTGPADGHYQVYGVNVALNYWATRHLRFTVDYQHYFFPGQPANGGPAGPEDNRMHGPHANFGNYGELMTRLGLVL